ncbi:holo-ACP synthase [Streptomyces apocyni]|uniref:holo-ACP synthase n=1 Tax=Streptomyces apocyni TaxID=2654677 RepID=UPI0012E9CB68|nr:holo-ACP synthase [Streptomyces apocyni]
MAQRIAVGVDLVRVDRVDRLLDDNPEAEQDIFTERERAYCAGKRNGMAHLAARFAAKEAVLKALGTGLGPGTRWHDVEVVNTPLGRPRVRLSGGAGARAARSGATSVELSLSHSGEYAIAHAVLLLDEPVDLADPAEPADPANSGASGDAAKAAADAADNASGKG